jgi:cyclic pyranopterin phosphate synthase
MKQESQLVDSYGRRLNYLRLSLTDLCNFRCVYCMPPEGLESVIPKSNYLTRNEILRFVKIIGSLGVDRIRLTGGEPLLRSDITDIVRALKTIESVKEISLTTNGSKLKKFLKPLKEAGLDRINISLDSLDPVRFKEVTLRDSYLEVLESTFLALEMGFPVKLNMVVLKGLTGKEIVDFVRLARDRELDVRFLEFMPLCGTGWRGELVFPIQKVRSIVKEHFELEEVERGDDVAQTFRIKGGKGRVGFIASLTESFCNDCSRIRLTADGKIRPCLFSEKEVSVAKLLREDGTDEEIIRAIRYAAEIKPKGNQYLEQPFDENNLEVKTLSAPLIRGIGG